MRQDQEDKFYLLDLHIFKHYFFADRQIIVISSCKSPVLCMWTGFDRPRTETGL